MEILSYIITALAAYLLGSIPTGYLVAKAKGIDIRSVGSGNIGATNVFRILGKGAGIFVLLADALKGFAACQVGIWAANHYFPPDSLGGMREIMAIVAGVSAILGHNYTCWLKFKGGKGIATTAGVLIALVPWALLIVLVIWILVFAISRYVSLASIVAAFCLPFVVWFLKCSQLMIFITAILALLAIYKHKANIQRLLNGTENRIGKKETGGGVEMKVAVIGAGAWGTALANLLCDNKHDVTLWGHDKNHLDEVRKHHRNKSRLPGIDLSRELKFEGDLSKAAEKAECIVIAVPSKFFREVTKEISGFSGIAVSVTKGIEYETGLTMSGVLNSTMPHAAASALSGPTLAMEVARNIPAAIVAANPDSKIAETIQNLFLRPTFRVYTSADLLGVELGGALKNIIAIAAGMSDGLGFGDNTKAALITRAIVEMRRLGVACGANFDTFSGLSGLGDLAVTCFSKLSRNRGFGERLGRGESIEKILASTSSVAEGYPTARSAFQLSKKLNIETPIIDEVYAMLYEGKHIGEAVRDLMSRDAKPED